MSLVVSYLILFISATLLTGLLYSFIIKVTKLKESHTWYKLINSAILIIGFNVILFTLMVIRELVLRYLK